MKSIRNTPEKLPVVGNMILFETNAIFTAHTAHNQTVNRLMNDEKKSE